MQQSRLLSIVEKTCWALGVAGVLYWGALHASVAIAARQDLNRFQALQAGATPVATPDQSLWSTTRVTAWNALLKEPAAAPIAVLRIPKIRLEVAVLPGTDEQTLNRAVGHIEDTAVPGTDGNSGIAGHRDSYFRGLQNIAVGDVIELETLKGTETYRIERTWIVDPEDVSVLDPTPARSITLVTCYPFYFVGSAPQRFIVRAVHVGDKSPSCSSSPCV